MNGWSGFRHATTIAIIAVGLAFPLATSVLAAANDEDQNDLREFHIGMKIADLPSSGYRDFVCAADPGRKLAGWAEYRECPSDARGWREIGFRYEETANPLAQVNSSYEGTKVAGHPVRLSLLIGPGDEVTGLRIATDPHTSLYLHKKAFLLADQVMARYGREGWACVKDAPGHDDEPLGGVFIKEHCEKTTARRRIIVDRALYRRSGEDVRHFVNETEILIEAPDARP